MLRRIAFLFVLFAAPVVLAQPAAGPGTKAIQDANAKITQLLQQKVTPGSPDEKKQLDQLKTVTRTLLDVDQLGKLALSNQWSKLTTAQQNEYLKVLRELIEANYIKGMRGNVSYKINYLAEGADPKNAANIVVKTEVVTERKGRPYKVAIDYTLAKVGKDLKVFDIATDGVGLVENYRAQFDKLIKDKGFDKLIDSMKQKSAELNAANNGTPAKP